MFVMELRLPVSRSKMRMGFGWATASSHEAANKKDFRQTMKRFFILVISGILSTKEKRKSA